MGYTDFTISKVQPFVRIGMFIIDLGAQNNYSHKAGFPAPFVSEWYSSQGMAYESIDLNGENNAITHDLGLLGAEDKFNRQCDLLVDAGTSEHVGRNGEFSWDAIYNCWRNKFKLLKASGIMYSENPLTGSWPLHGFNYYTTEFYYQLCDSSDMVILDIGLHPACHNARNGWNVWCILKKTGDRFVDRETFKTFNLRTS